MEPQRNSPPQFPEATEKRRRITATEDKRQEQRIIINKNNTLNFAQVFHAAMEEKKPILARKQQKRSWNEMQFNKFIGHDARAMTLFAKHFPILDLQSEYVLPEPNSVFKEQPWQLDNLQTLKEDLNRVKSRLNDFNLDEWQRHTYRMNWAGDVLSYVKRCVCPEFTTQAWCKFYEIVCSFPLVPLNEISRNGGSNNFTSVHLCEAPGAFVVALNHWLKLNARHVRWDWMASTLNPYCEGNPYNKMVEDDRFIRHTLRHWCFGADNTGNLMRLANLDALVERSKAIADDGRGPIMLVTADGSIDCTDMPGEQENAVVHLQLCETIACMHLLQEGGNFLLKVFTLFEHQSVCLMYLLSCAFQQVTVTKPATSKAGNSEMYVVCLNFKGREHVAPYLSVLRQHYDVCPARAMFSQRYIEDCFMETIKNCSEFFKRHQCEVIENNINAFHSKSYNKLLIELKQIRQEIASMYLKNYKLTKISPMDEIIGRKVIEKSSNYIMTKKMRHDSYNERCKKQNLKPIERLRRIWNETIEINLPGERSYTYNLQTLPETLEIQKGELFNKIYSSRFCEANILQVLNEIKSAMQNTSLVDKFPSAEITKKWTQLIDPDYEIVTFQFVQPYDSHQMIAKVYHQLKKLRAEKTFILIGYPLLTQLNVGLLYILGNSFDKIIIEIHDNEGYLIKLEHYIHNEKVLDHLHEIFVTSRKEYKENMAIWSVIPMSILYEWDQYPLIMQLNHLVIQSYIRHVLSMIDKIDNKKDI